MTSDQINALVTDLILECERAIKQRDEFFRTGQSTADHGGSHDTCFEFVLAKHGVIAEWERLHYKMQCIHADGCRECNWCGYKSIDFGTYHDFIRG